MNIVKKGLYALMFLLFAWAENSSAEEISSINCPKVADAPKIDGVLDDAIWQKAGKTGKFYGDLTISIYTFAKNEFASIAELTPEDKKMLEKLVTDFDQTTAYAAHDDKKLYLAYVCQDSNVAGLHADVKKRDGKVWNDDCCGPTKIESDRPPALSGRWNAPIRPPRTAANTRPVPLGSHSASCALESNPKRVSVESRISNSHTSRT